MGAASSPAGRAKSVRMISAHMFLNVCNKCQGLTAEPLLATAICGGDASAAMRMLASSSLVSGVLQFLLNPTFGTLSDRFGRKPFFLIGPASSIAWCGLVAAFPRNRALFLLCRTLSKALGTLSGSTICSAALSDCASGDELSTASGRLGSAACTGVIFGPLLGAALLARGFGARAVYALQTVSFAIQSVIVVLLLPETLQVRVNSLLALSCTANVAVLARLTLRTLQRRPGEKRPAVRFVNPLSFTRLFAHGRKLGLLSASAGFACFVDGSNLNDIEQMWIKEDVPDMGIGSNSLYLMLW
jgi:MFS family permease